MTSTDWIAALTIAAPLLVQAFSTWQANAVANHNARLARLVGMAGREASTIARTLASQPANMPTGALETSLIKGSVEVILSEMGGSAVAVGADADKLTTIVQGELNKVLTAPVVVQPPSTELTRGV